MRILMLTQFYPPIIGGEERHIQNLSLELVARGHSVSVATVWHDGMKDFECDQGVNIYRIHASMPRINALFSEQELRCSPPFPDPEVLWALRRIITDERPDIVHAHNWMVHSFTPLKSWSKAKLVATLHDCTLICAQQQFLYKGGELCDGPGAKKCLTCTSKHYGMARGVPITLSNWFWKGIEQQAVDMFLPVSQAIAQANQLAEQRLPYRVIPNFIPDELEVTPFEGEDSSLAQLLENDYLLYVGAVRRSKGIEVLLQAYAEMTCSIPLILIGKLMDDSAVDIPPNVHILHTRPHAAVMHAWSRCTLALIPSICPDACPTVAMEAMVMGRPVIASHIGGLPEIVADGETGLLVPPDNPAALRESIQKLLANSVLRDQMGTRAKQRVALFQAHTVIPHIEQVYQEMLQL